jgi:hypothetical protein
VTGQGLLLTLEERLRKLMIASEAIMLENDKTASHSCWVLNRKHFEIGDKRLVQVIRKNPKLLSKRIPQQNLDADQIAEAICTHFSTSSKIEAKVSWTFTNCPMICFSLEVIMPVQTTITNTKIIRNASSGCMVIA